MEVIGALEEEPVGARLARREETALEEVYSAYGPSLLAYLRRFVGDDAEDVLQRTLMDVWRQADRYEPTMRLSSWLFTIAHRRAVDTLRTRRHDVVPVEDARDLVGEDGRETAERYAEAADVHAALARLGERDREVLELAYFEGLTQREIADHLDLPLGTVKARAVRAARRLADLVRTDDPDGADR
ncbi:RNA polymerase sigma factor [Nocardioides sp. P86]|uniref:RNA polymerase sigma factor n=1 Tax=Nocardioides sp. P86 TaxID=2939569 RepID=UPI00203F6D2D|nr:sigma-70 family RNA polymerase sigma factor [Nocardioides sp. P86]MCM3517274.1 sigma-70 family RNA polymerase sigma factor [Nocardioides sp. P86]